MADIRMTKKFFKENARKKLYSNWITHIAAFFTVGICTVGLYAVCESFLMLFSEFASDELLDFQYVFYVAFTVLMSIPLLYGICVFEYNSLNSDKPSIADIFYAFSSLHRFRRSYLLFYSLLWRAFLTFIVPALISYQIYLYKGGFSSVLENLIGAFSPVSYYTAIAFNAVIYVICAAFFARYFAAVYIIIDREDTPVSHCYLFARVCMYGCGRYFSAMLISFLPLLVVSVLTFGVLFIIYTLPVMLLSLFGLASYVYKKELAEQKISSSLISGAASDDVIY